MKNNLRVLLAERKVSVKELHELTQISVSTLTNIYYERANNPSTNTVKRIAKVLNVTLDELLNENLSEKGA